jgi:hypothetical protein
MHYINRGAHQSEKGDTFFGARCYNGFDTLGHTIGYLLQMSEMKYETDVDGYVEPSISSQDLADSLLLSRCQAIGEHYLPLDE